MKKWVWIAALTVALVGSIYFFSPARTTLAREAGVTVNAKAFARVFSDEESWRGWWPGQVSKTDSGNLFRYKGRDYKIASKKYTSLVITIRDANGIIPSELFFVPADDDSVHLLWQGSSPTFNFTDRLKRLFQHETLASDADTILQRLKAFYQTESLLYGGKIEKSRVHDSTLIATSFVTTGQPGTQTVYAMIEKLQAFAATKGARQTGLPMLNVSPADGGKLRVQTALPVDKKLRDEGDIHYRWMLGGGNILVSEVRGGPHAIQKAYARLDDYVKDNHRIAPALPFQSLVTDRRTEPDTNKWVTRVYWPVM